MGFSSPTLSAYDPTSRQIARKAAVDHRTTNDSQQKRCRSNRWWQGSSPPGFVTKTPSALQRAAWLNMCSLVSMSLLVGTTSAQTPTIVPQRGHTSSVEAVAFNEAGNLLATAGSDKVILWDVSSGLMWTSIDVPLAAGTSLVGFASGDQLVFSVNSFGIHAYDTHTRALKWERQDGATSSAASSFANRLVYAVGSASQGDLKVVDTRDGHDVRLIHTAVTVPTISLSADASLLAVGSRHGANALGTNPIKGAPDHRLAIYDVQTGLVKFELSTESSWCSTVAFSPNGDLLAAVTYEKVPPAVNSYGNVVLQVWRLTDRTVHIRVPLPYKYSLGSALSFEKKGDRLALAVAGNDVPRGKSMFVADSAGQLQPMESPRSSIVTLLVCGPPFATVRR